tara:strand:- start:14697 stop:15107 length:411 start_codon:yes stop_codon:yes gene_type:complete
MARISWKEYALRLAETAALRSEDPYRKVGACALDSNRRVLALGYNGLASGKNAPAFSFWNDRDARRPFMIHAEVNCLSMVNVGECRLLAVNLLPCSSCAQMIAAYKIPEIVYREEYERDTTAHEIFKFYDIILTKK